MRFVYFLSLRLISKMLKFKIYLLVFFLSLCTPSFGVENVTDPEPMSKSDKETLVELEVEDEGLNPDDFLKKFHELEEKEMENENKTHHNHDHDVPSSTTAATPTQKPMKRNRKIKSFEEELTSTLNMGLILVGIAIVVCSGGFIIFHGIRGQNFRSTYVEFV